MQRLQARTRIWLGALACSGVVFAHLLAYLLVAPDTHHRADLLESTGHGSWALVVALSLGALVAAFGGFALRVVRKPGLSPSMPSCALRLAALQTVGFAGLEAVERAWHEGFGLEAFAEPVFIIGLIAQLVVAIVAAGLLVLFTRAIERLVARRRPSESPAPSPTFGLHLRAVPPRRLIASGSGTLRGPPLRA